MVFRRRGRCAALGAGPRLRMLGMVLDGIGVGVGVAARGGCSQKRHQPVAADQRQLSRIRVRIGIIGVRGIARGGRLRLHVQVSRIAPDIIAGIIASRVFAAGRDSIIRGIVLMLVIMVKSAIIAELLAVSRQTVLCKCLCGEKTHAHDQAEQQRQATLHFFHSNFPPIQIITGADRNNPFYPILYY